MRFEPTEEQAGFARSLSDLLERADTVAVARAWAEGDTAPGLALWRRLADQGVHGIVADEDLGGMGGSPVDLAVAFEVLGYHLAVGPWIESAAYAPAMLRGLTELDAHHDWEESVATSIHSVAIAGHLAGALDADVADAVFAVEGRRVALARPGEVRRSVDVTRRLFEVTEVRALGSVEGDALDLAFDAAALACSAQLLGCGERILAETVAYAKQRRQFGREIGSYQAIKHQLADVRIALDFVGPLVHGAALGDVPVSAAKVAASDAAYLASRVGLQVHGAIGYTRECDLSLWLGRVRALVTAWGTPAHHRARLAERITGGAA